MAPDGWVAPLRCRPVLLRPPYFAAAALVGLAWLAFTIYAALDLNPQGVYDDIVALAMLGAVNFAVAFVPSLLPSGLLALWLVARRCLRRPANEPEHARRDSVAEAAFAAVFLCLGAHLVIAIAGVAHASDDTGLGLAGMMFGAIGFVTTVATVVIAGIYSFAAAVLGVSSRRWWPRTRLS